MRVTLCGPIGYWWDENWNTPQHWRYVEWRDLASRALVDAGHLVYRPHEAFKGAWDANDGDALAQHVNNAAILASDVIFDLTPDGIPSPGTDVERALCRDHSKVVIVAPPPDWPNLVDAETDWDAIRDYIRQAEHALTETAA